jgi:single-stranded-DNA-specific exonuclease
MEAFGGHQYAAGLTIREENIGLLRERFGSIVGDCLTPEDFQPGLMVDAEVQLDDLSLRLMRELDQLSPYGVANPEPVLVARALEPLFPKVVGKSHLKLRVRSGPVSCDAIGFQMGDHFSRLLSKEARIDLAFTLTQDTWQGRERLQLRIRDLKAHETREEGEASRGVGAHGGGSGCETVC